MLVLVLLPRLLWADSAPSAPPVTSIVLPKAYRVLCDTEPALRSTVLRPYAQLLSNAKAFAYTPFFAIYQTRMKEIAGPIPQEGLDAGPDYPIVLAWIHPVTRQKVHLEAYVNKPTVLQPHLVLGITDNHNPVLMTIRHVYWMREPAKKNPLQGALQDFLVRNPYPVGQWQVDIRATNYPSIVGVYPSQNGSTLSPDLMLQFTPVLRFRDSSGVVSDCAQRTPRENSYAIFRPNDPKLDAVVQQTQRVQALRAHPLQQGALLTYLEPPKDHSGLTEAVVFANPKTFTGFLVAPDLAGPLQAALADKDAKRSLDKLYELVADPTNLLAFSSYEDLSKRFFYSEVFSKEAVLNPKAELDLRQQKGWEQWRKDADKELSDITGLTVNPSGCIKGTRPDGENFEVCGEKTTNKQIKFYQKTKHGKKLIGSAQVGEPLRTRRGLLQDAKGKTVAYVPLESKRMHNKLPKAIKLVVYNLPHDAFQVVADLFTFQGVWDLGVYAVKGLIKDAVLDWFGAGWVNDLYKAVTTIQTTYQVYDVLSTLWVQLDEAKEEYHLYDAADGVSPAIQALLKQMAQQHLVEKAKAAYKKGTGATAQNQPQPQGQRMLPGPKAPYGLLTTTDLILDSNEKALFTEANAQALLAGPTATYELEIPEDEHGFKLTFFDKDHKPLLTKEGKSVDEVGKEFTKAFGERLLEGAREKGEDGPRELDIQVPAGQDVAGALQHFRDNHEGKKWLAKFQGEDLVVVDPAHKELYHGPVLATGPSPPRAQQEAPVNLDPKNNVQLEKLKHKLRIIMEKPHVEDPKLARTMNELYRDEAIEGSGSTAAAVRQELRTGEPTQGKRHSEKARGYIKNLTDWLRDNPTARPGDRAAAENVLQDMRDALKGN